MKYRSMAIRTTIFFYLIRVKNEIEIMWMLTRVNRNLIFLSDNFDKNQKTKG